MQYKRLKENDNETADNFDDLEMKEILSNNFKEIENPFNMFQEKVEELQKIVNEKSS